MSRPVDFEVVNGPQQIVWRGVYGHRSVLWNFCFDKFLTLSSHINDDSSLFSVKMNFPQSLKNLERSFLFRTLARRISFIDACGQIWEIEGRSRTQSCSGKFHSAVCWFLFWTMPNLGKLCWETRWNWFETQVYQLDWAAKPFILIVRSRSSLYSDPKEFISWWFFLLKYQYLGKQGFAMRGLNFSPL